MRSPSVLLLTICCLTIALITGQLDFDCRRLGVSCGNGDCDLSTGKCDCTKVTGSTTGYRCQANDGKVCLETEYGDDCSMSRVQIDCTGDEMFVIINPHATFQGSIYVINRAKDDACQLKDQAPLPDYVTNKDKVEGWRLKLEYENSACGNALKTTGNETGRKTTTFVRDYFVQYDKNFKTALDQKISVKCVITEGLAKVTGQVNEVLEGDSNYKEIDVDANADLDVVNFDIKNKDSADLTSAVNLGDEIKLIFTMKPSSGFVDFSLESCSANNTVSNQASGDLLSINFLKNNCPSAEGQALFRNGISKEGGATANDTSTITVSISAFMFSGASSKVGFLCSVKLCQEADKDSCRMTDCQGITSEADKQRELTKPTTPEPSGPNDNATDTSNTTDTNNNGQNDTVSDTNPTAADNVTTVANDNATAASPDATTGTTAAPTAAPIAAPVLERRRRRAAGDEEPVKQMYNEMTVRDPSVPVDEPKTMLSEDKDCLQETEVITVITILSVLVVVLFSLTVVILCHVTRSGAKKQSPSSSKDDVTPIQTFNIPRLEISAKRHNNYATA